MFFVSPLSDNCQRKRSEDQKKRKKRGKLFSWGKKKTVRHNKKRKHFSRQTIQRYDSAVSSRSRSLALFQRAPRF